MSTSDTTSVLDEDYTVGAEGGPQWGVIVITGATRKKQKRIRRTDQPWFSWNIAFSVKDADSAALLRAFRDAHQGGLKPFRFKWEDDHTAEDELFGSASGDEHQLVINRDFGDETLDLEIYRPVESITVKRGTSLGGASTLTEGAGFDVDYRTGVVTLSSELSTDEMVWWSGEFHFLVRFVGNPAIRFDSENIRAFNDIILESVE